jgi:hypothetical protein
VLSVVAIGTPIGYFVFKRFKRDPSGNTSNTGTIEMDEDGYLAPTNPNTGTIETSMDGGYLTPGEMNFGANNYITPITNTDPQVDLDNVTIGIAHSATDSFVSSFDMTHCNRNSGSFSAKLGNGSKNTLRLVSCSPASTIFPV